MGCSSIRASASSIPATLACTGADASDCLTAAQVDSVRKIYEGLKDPATGAQFWAGFEVSSEVGWAGHILDAGGPPLSYFKYMVLRDPAWDWKSLRLRGPEVPRAARRRVPPPGSRPRLDRRRPGALQAAWRQVDHLSRLARSEHRAAQQHRLLRAGQGTHGRRGGDAVVLPALHGPGDGALRRRAWAEHLRRPHGARAVGRARDAALAHRRVTHSADGKVDRTRPLCVHPQVAAYKGTGSTDEAASFECRVP